jgi:hypothetical protein
MTFNQEFLRELQKELSNSDLYRITKTSVNFFLKSKQHNTDKTVIFDAIRNDVIKNGDPLLLRKLWNKRINDSKLRFD